MYKDNSVNTDSLKTGASRYRDLDALRGFASVMVVVFHFTYGREQARYGFFLGSTGVDLFFIISGFVIFMSINKVASAKEFMINRFSRLFPAYWTCVTLTAAVQFTALRFHFVHPDSVNISWLKYLANLTMFQKYFGYSNVDGSYWSLLIEMLFYIGIVLLFKFNKIKNIFGVGVITLTVILINDFLANNFAGWPFEQITFWLPIVHHAALFFAGILFYKFVNQTESQTKLYLAIICCYLVQLKIYYTIRGLSSTINFSQYACALAVIFLVFILFANNKLSFITNTTTLFFGKISYSLYLLHQFLGAGIIIPGLERFLHFNFLTAAVIAFIVITALAYIVTTYIETPVGKKIKNKLYQGYVKQSDLSVTS